LRLSDAHVREVHLAGLVHDLGLVAVPSFVLNKVPDERNSAERDALGVQRDVLRSLFDRTPALARIGQIAWLHHERPVPSVVETDADLLLAAGIVAAANEFDELTHDAPGRLALAAEQALPLVRSAFAGSAFQAAAEAMVAEIGGRVAAPQGQEQFPAALTGREVEVLRLLASGLNRKKIAGELVVSESTVRTHLEHIYDKLDVSTRVGAVLFALEHGLVL
jgi:DNA-binding CsgD family transcriptional regulator